LHYGIYYYLIAFDVALKCMVNLKEKKGL